MDASVFEQAKRRFDRSPSLVCPANSGTSDAPVTYRAAKEGEVILSGGMRIEG